jgi:hypothetical protein
MVMVGLDTKFLCVRGVPPSNLMLPFFSTTTAENYTPELDS